MPRDHPTTTAPPPPRHQRADGAFELRFGPDGRLRHLFQQAPLRVLFPTPEPGEPPLPGFVRPLLLAVGGAQSAVALVLLLMPSTMIEHWPWQLTPLTAQTLGGWFALPGVTALMMGIDGRWSAIRITLESQLIGLALILLGTARAWEDLDTSNALAYAFVTGIAALFAALLTLRVFMARRG
jgi:hypothetical protein